MTMSQARVRRSLPRVASGMACALAICLGAGLACAPPPAETSADTSDLPEFTASEAALFDDAFSLGVFGAEFEETAPSADPKLADRTAQADAVVAVRVSTVTRDSGGDLKGYVIVVTPVGQPLAGSVAPEPVELEVTEQSPSFPFVSSADAGLVGQKLILFLKRYNDRGAAVVHWRLELDSDEVRKAIADASALEEISP
jgi:hypothetical protein